MPYPVPQGKGEGSRVVLQGEGVGRGQCHPYICVVLVL